MNLFEDQIALFDMDNSICDWDKAMERDLRNVLPPEMGPDIDRWLREDRRNRPEWVENLMSTIRTQVGWWRNLEEFEIGMRLFRIAISQGWKVNVLTKGPATKPYAWAEKVEWCAAHLSTCTGLAELDRPVPVTCCADKSLVYGKVLVDDYPPYIEKWLKYRKNGLVLMPAHYYNADFNHPNVLRVTKHDINRAATAMSMAFNRKEGEPLILEK